MIIGMTYYEFFMLFLIYSFIGWVVEVIFHAVTLGKVINRGFLCGPVCPVYGFGMLAVMGVLNALPSGSESGWTIFVSSMLLATLVELIAGWALDIIFHMRWWDYSDIPFNLHGYICLKFSIYWGLGGIIVVKVAHPAICQMSVNRIPEKIGVPIMIFLYIVYLADTIITAACVNGLNQRLKEIDEIRRAMRIPSDKMTETIAGGSLKTVGMIEHTRVQAALAEAELKDQFADKKESLMGVRDQLLEKTGQIMDVKDQLLEKTGQIMDVKDQLLEKTGQIMDVKDQMLEKTGQMQEKYVEMMSTYEGRLAELKVKITRENIVSRHLLRAFPNVMHRQYGDILRELAKQVVPVGKKPEDASNKSECNTGENTENTAESK